MNLHEYQAKDLFREYGIFVSKGIPVVSSSEIKEAINSLEGDRWVVKAQVHAGGRGKAGGVELVDSVQEAEAFAEKWLGHNLVTYQTDERGQPVNTILIEECIDIAEELYLGAVIDRASQRLVFMASQEGPSDVVNRLLECKQINVNLQAKVSEDVCTPIICFIGIAHYLLKIALYIVFIIIDF